MTDRDIPELVEAVEQHAEGVMNEYSELADALDELQRSHDHEEARKAFGDLEDLVMDLDDVTGQAVGAVQR